MKQMNIYCAGGCATNIGAHFIKYVNRKDQGFAALKTFFIDTSRSNINKEIPDESIYLVDGVDGSGKRRDANYAALSECSKEILHKFRPADVNLVIHSASGGTGSTLGPILVSELLSRSEVVIVLTVGGTASRIETDNTIKTLKSYEMISRKREMPVNVYYRENSNSTARGAIDHEIQKAIVVLAAIFSGNNQELDSSDLKNFLNYPRVTSYSPKLSLLDFFSKNIELGKGQSVVSLVTLADRETPSDSNVPVEYQAVGYLPEETKKMVSVELPIHAAVVSGYFNHIIEALQQQLTAFDEVRKIVNEKPIVKDDEDHTSEGLIF